MLLIFQLVTRNSQLVTLCFTISLVILDRTQYENAIKEIISDKTKFKELPEEVTIK